jgi:hypothetical protein
MERGEPKECGSTNGAGEGKRARRKEESAGRRGKRRGASDTTRPGATERALGAPRPRHKGLRYTRGYPSAASSPQLNASRPFPILFAPIASLTIKIISPQFRIIPTRSITPYTEHAYRRGKKKLFCVRDMTMEKMLTRCLNKPDLRE